MVDEPSPESTAPPSSLVRSRSIARLLDGAFTLPGTNFRFGLDPLLGLLPGAGDFVSWTISLHHLWTGWRLRAGPATMVRMAGHLLLDAVLGAIPAIGNVFDFVYRANDRNLRILEALFADPDRTRRSSLLWLIGIGGGATAMVATLIWVVLRVMMGIWSLLPL